jgi:hypothetical protein
VADVIHQTPPPTSVSKIVIVETTEAEATAAEATGAETTKAETVGAEATGAEATGAEAGTTEDPNLETTLDDIDNILLKWLKKKLLWLR